MFRGYTILFPSLSANNKYRLLLLVRQDAAAQYRAKVVRTTPLEIWLELHLPCGPTLVCAIYRQWTANEEADLQAFHGNLRDFSAKYDRILVLGDVNLDWSRRGDPKYYRRKLLQEHCDCLQETQLRTANELDPSPTCKSYAMFAGPDGDRSAKESVLDHLYYTGMPPPKFRVLPFAATDHRPILALFELKNSRSSLKRSTCRNFKSLDASICWAINAEKLSSVFHLDDVEEIHRVIVREITAAMDLVIPQKTILVKERKIPLYLSAATLRAMENRDAVAAKGDNHVLYRKLRNKVNRLVRKDKLASNMALLKKTKLDPKTVWTIANEATGRASRCGLPPRLVKAEEVVEGDFNLATYTNSFYLNKIIEIRRRIDATAADGDEPASPPTKSAANDNTQFRFRAPTEGEVLRIILRLNNTQALGVDGIPVAVLKQLAPVIAAPFAHLIRRSFETSTVPNGFKLARVTPVYKGRGKALDDVANYRPISILSSMSKIMERAALLQLSPHLAPLLPQSQHGFRPRRSTSMAILAAQGSWAEARARGLLVGIAGYDMSSAFDTVDAGMLTKKLEGLGVRCKEKKWFSHYLQGRQQQVDHNGTCSSYSPVPFGVPQGSILGPVLFLVLVSDLPSAILRGGGGDGGGTDGGSDGGDGNRDGLEVGISGYADDVAVWVAGKDASLVRERLEQISKSLMNYCSMNYLALNGSKTQVLWSGCTAQPVRVGDVLVPPAPTFEFLGISFDKHLAVTPHLNALVNSAKAMVIMCRRLLQHLPSPLVKTIMQSMIRGKIGYACAVLPPRFNEQDPVNGLMAKIQTSLNEVARSIVGCRRSDRRRVEEILQESSIPSLNKVVIETIGVECWKALNVRDAPDLPLAPIGTLLMASRKCDKRKTRAVSNNSLPPPTRIQMDVFAWWAHIVWNTSPPLRAATTLNAAKSAATSFAASAPN